MSLPRPERPRLTEAELSNLITACKTSSMRTGSPPWQATLDALAVKLTAMRDIVATKD